MRKTIIRTAASVALVAAMAACTGNKGWQVEGTVTDAADTTVYIEGSTAASWFVMDSVKTDANGKFKYAAKEAAQIPSIYRLRMGNDFVYFPVDSIETVTVTADKLPFGSSYTLSGNIYARGFAKADSLINAAIDRVGSANAAADADLKRELNLIINRDTTCLVSYYVVGKFIGNQPLYKATDRKDMRMIANAANNYKRLRPNDVRAAELEQRWLACRRAAGTLPGYQAEATVTARPKVELKRFDREGKEHDFDKVVDRGHPTVLSFTRYDGDNSPAYTAILRDVYQQYKAKGLEIFQIAYDPDELSWKRSAANMPWIAVWNGPMDPLDALVAYNVNPIEGDPVSFVFDSKGELVKRVVDPAELASALAPLF